MRDYRFHPEARAELLEAARYYRNEGRWVEEDFEEEVERAIEFILDRPEASPVAGIKGVRRKLLKRFPYSLYYPIEPDRIRILSVAHDKRRPGYWASRR